MHSSFAVRCRDSAEETASSTSKECEQLKKMLDDTQRKLKELEVADREGKKRIKNLEEEKDVALQRLADAQAQRPSSSIATHEQERTSGNNNWQTRSGQHELVSDNSDSLRERHGTAKQQQVSEGAAYQKRSPRQTDEYDSRQAEEIAQYAQDVAQSSDDTRKTALSKARAKIRKQRSQIQNLFTERQRLIIELESLKSGLEYAHLRPQEA